MGLTPARCTPSVTGKSFLLHLLAFLWSCFGIYCDRTFYSLPKFKEYGGRTQYLTMITAYVNLGCYGIGFFVDLLQIVTGFLESKKITNNGYQEHQSFLISLRDDLISFWAFTLSTFVVIMYWGIAAIDLEGLHPEEDRKYVPLFGWYNQYLHTLPIFVIFILIVNINYSYGSYKKSLVYTVMLGSSYLFWITHLAKVKGYWAYPFMEKLDKVQFSLFIVLCHVIFFAVYLIGRKVSASVWSQERKERIIIEQERKGL